MQFMSLLLPSLLTVTVAASSASSLERRATTWCGAFNKLETGRNNNNVVQWSTDWTWEGGSNQVKSYSNVAIDNVNKKIREVNSIPSTWSWSNSGTNVVADVAYDLWLAPWVGANNQYEIMIWLGSIGGAGPISETGSTPIASPTILGRQWNLFKGPNGAVTVFSFIATGGNIQSFDGDLKQFFNYLTSSQGVNQDMTITSLQAGTEPFTGSNAVFNTWSFTMSVN
ncbi:xyloglucan-specific endo-beta-1,4-glucanase A [Fusarium austroafricanum]|uniref:Xyloglucan-specific endo-beta-1,4-glucanase A n=1 Tax=Fusarium austroafricanum TaxID=2364996 RepID=A0A8H4NU62_9HYPO|nr:xyloglucan-specific endo-beta-1,4-glucanase A [Fusarium austroafricanum]